MGISKKRGRRRDQGRLCESRASNKFGHREEMELFGIDNAGLYQWRRGKAERVDVSLWLIQSKVVLCTCKHVHMHTQFTQRPGQDNPFIHAASTHSQHIKQNVMRTGAAILVMKLKTHPDKWKEKAGNKILWLGSVPLSCFPLSSAVLCSRLLGSGDQIKMSWGTGGLCDWSVK